MVDVVFLAAYRRANGSGPWAWPRVDSRLVLFCLHRVNWVRCPCSDIMDMLRHLINCCIIIIIISLILFAGLALQHNYTYTYT